jgi:mono/diheme cytochrome c family protein
MNVCVITLAAIGSAAVGTASSQSAGKVDAEELYKLKCQVCHQDGNSQLMPNMSFADGVWKGGSTIKEVSKTIMEGVTGTAMMPFKSQLSAEEVAALARFVRKFDKKLK